MTVSRNQEDILPRRDNNVPSGCPTRLGTAWKLQQHINTHYDAHTPGYAYNHLERHNGGVCLENFLSELGCRLYPVLMTVVGASQTVPGWS